MRQFKWRTSGARHSCGLWPCEWLDLLVKFWPVTLRLIWLARTESRSVRAIWLACTESRSVWAIWLAGTESRSVGEIWLDNTESRSVWKIWLVCTESRSVLNALIGRSDFLVLKERSDWMIRLVGPERAIWLDNLTCWSRKSDLIGQSRDLSLGAFDGLLVSQLQIVVCEQQENDTRNASCFATNLPFKLLLRAKQTNDRLFLYYLLYPWWSFKTVHFAQRWSSVSDDVVYV